MKRRAMWTAVALVLLATLAAGQAPEQYLDVYTVQVKPEKRADFDAITKRMVAANRQNKGDSWLTTETVYGQGDRVTFISIRQGYGDAEKASDTFYGAVQKALGKAGTDKLFLDYNQCVVSSRSEFRYFCFLERLLLYSGASNQLVRNFTVRWKKHSLTTSMCLSAVRTIDGGV